MRDSPNRRWSTFNFSLFGWLSVGFISIPVIFIAGKVSFNDGGEQHSILSIIGEQEFGPKSEEHTTFKIITGDQITVENKDDFEAIRMLNQHTEEIDGASNEAMELNVELKKALEEME